MGQKKLYVNKLTFELNIIKIIITSKWNIKWKEYDRSIEWLTTDIEIIVAMAYLFKLLLLIISLNVYFDKLIDIMVIVKQIYLYLIIMVVILIVCSNMNFNYTWWIYQFYNYYFNNSLVMIFLYSSKFAKHFYC